MKRKLLLSALALGGALSLQAQEVIVTEKEQDSPRRRVVIVDEEPVEDGRDGGYSSSRTIVGLDLSRKPGGIKFNSMIGIGYNGLVQDPGHLKLPEGAEWMELEAKSININLRLLEYAWYPTRNFGFHTGLDLDVANFRFSRNVIPEAQLLGTGRRQGDTYVGPHYIDREEGLKKSKLVNSYFNIPLVAAVNLGRRDQVGLYGGVVGGWRWNSYVKEKSSAHGKERTRPDLNLRNFHYGYTAGILFARHVGLYATYYPHSIFRSGQGPDVRQVNFGISLFY